jgi:hypothetical protein
MKEVIVQDAHYDMSTLFWTYLNRTIYLMVYEFIGNNKIAFLALSRVK